MNTEQPKGQWFQNLLTEVNSMAEMLGLDDHATDRFKDFVIRISKDQYKAGNRSGIDWARSQSQGKA